MLQAFGGEWAVRETIVNVLHRGIDDDHRALHARMNVAVADERADTVE